jgi:hypothetical protein
LTAAIIDFGLGGLAPGATGPILIADKHPEQEPMTPQMTRRGAISGLLAAPLLIESVDAKADQLGSAKVRRVDQKRPFPVNAYIVEGAEGLVIVDALLTVSASRDLRRQADAIGKPIKAVLLTHPHPDHYAGLSTVTAGLNVPIVAQAGVDDVVRRDDDQKDKIVGPMFGAEWPKSRAFPNERVGDGTRLAFGPGLVFRAVDIGPPNPTTTACSFSREIGPWRLSAT